ncbi:unnamed protein product [Symbiodinium microadriaticum]|nr:unnamed protein product [Symbiodinium microadriaticum]
MFGTPERDEADEDCSDLEELEDEGDEELAELQHEDGAEVNKPSDEHDLEDDGGAELEELEHEDGAEVYKPSEGQELAQGPAEEEEWADSLPVSPGEDFDPDECAANVSPAGVAEICSSPEKAEIQEDLHAKDRASELRDRLRELKKQMELKREDTQLVPPDLLDRAAEKMKAMPSSEATDACWCVAGPPNELVVHPCADGLQPVNDKKDVIDIEDTAERGPLFRRPSSGDLRALRCDLSNLFEAVETRNPRPPRSSQMVLQDVARPLASFRKDSEASVEPPPPEPSAPCQKGSSQPCAEPCVASKTDPVAKPFEACDKADYMVSQNDSKPSRASPNPEPCVAPQKVSTPKPKQCVSKKAGVEPVVDKAPQNDSKPSVASENPKPCVASAPKPKPCVSKKAPVEPILEKDLFPKASSEDAGEGAKEIPEVPESFTRLQQRGLRKAQVAAQRKRKHAEENESGSEKPDAEEAEPRGRGCGRGARGRGGRGRGGRGSRDEDAGRSRSPKVLKRPAAKQQVIPKAKAVAKEKKPKTGKALSARSAAVDGESGGGDVMQEKLKLVLQGLPLLRAQAAEKMQSHPDYHSRDLLPIPTERRAGLKAIVGCTKLCSKKDACITRTFDNCDNFKLEPYWTRSHCGIRYVPGNKHVLVVTYAAMTVNIAYCNLVAT